MYNRECIGRSDAWWAGFKPGIRHVSTRSLEPFLVHDQSWCFRRLCTGLCSIGSASRQNTFHKFHYFSQLSLCPLLSIVDPNKILWRKSYGASLDQWVYSHAITKAEESIQLIKGNSKMYLLLCLVSLTLPDSFHSTLMIHILFRTSTTFSASGWYRDR